MVVDWEQSGPIDCQATFKEHCHFPHCDCDRPKSRIFSEKEDWRDSNWGDK